MLPGTHRPVLRDPVSAQDGLRGYCPREAQQCPGAAQRSPGQARLTSRGKGLGVGLGGCCWSAMACRVISRACGEAVVVTGQARAQGTSCSPSGTHQEDGLLVDEGLLQSQRGRIQAWDWGGAESEDVDPQGRKMEGHGNSLANAHPAAVSPPPGGLWLPLS